VARNNKRKYEALLLGDFEDREHESKGKEF
jgi:hypothetical protein